jgi:hypothetical protein
MNCTRGAWLFAAMSIASGLSAQVTWERRATSGPLTLFGVLCTDPSEQAVVQFGGAGILQAFPTDTWTWDGSMWHQSNPSPSPPGRHAHAMAYDSWRRQVVLFGGAAISSFFNDTWVWNGTAWTLEVPTRSPPPAWNFAMAFDRTRGVVVLFGGERDGPSISDETWEWDGSDWTQRHPPTSPGARAATAMAYDDARQQMVLFGGYGPARFADTWIWDGAAWMEKRPVSSPSARSFHSMVYDVARERVVLWGGSVTSGQTVTETWDWDGSTWLERRPVASPPFGSRALAYRPDARRVVMYDVPDTWEYFATNPADYGRFGAGCAGSAGVPQLESTSLPWVGGTLTLRLSNLPRQMPVALNLGFSNSAWGALSLPFPLAGIGMPGCWLLVSPDILCSIPGTSGTTTFGIAIPNDPSLVGLSFHNQAVVLDPGANPLGLTTSNGGTGRIGAR